jgi:hypothetical protein
MGWLWNEVANLPQQVQFCGGWNILVVFFHPCRVAGLNKIFQLFLKSCGMAVKLSQKKYPSCSKQQKMSSNPLLSLHPLLMIVEFNPNQTR